MERLTRGEATRRIKAGLKRRSGGIAYSVHGGTGTAWGWIHIGIPEPRMPATREEIERLHTLLDWPDGKPASLPCRGLTGTILVPASSDYWQEYIDRAEGRAPSVRGRQYWD